MLSPCATFQVVSDGRKSVTTTSATATVPAVMHAAGVSAVVVVSHTVPVGSAGAESRAGHQDCAESVRAEKEKTPREITVHVRLSSLLLL